MSSFSTLLIENRNGLRIIKLNSPKSKNSLRFESYKELEQAFSEAAADQSVKVLALTGTGDFYSSGNDMKSIAARAGGDVDAILAESHRMLKSFIRAFYTFPKPLVGVVNGPCIGIAATTVALCDVIYASKTAYFYTPFTSLGLCAEGCSSYTFPRILGKSKAAEMLMLNHKMSVEEAYRFNFVSEIFEPTEIEKIWDKLEATAELPMGSLIACKELINKYETERLEEVNVAEIAALEKRWKSDEAMEAVMKFMMRSRSNKSKM